MCSIIICKWHHRNRSMRMNVSSVSGPSDCVRKIFENRSLIKMNKKLNCIELNWNEIPAVNMSDRQNLCHSSSHFECIESTEEKTKMIYSQNSFAMQIKRIYYVVDMKQMLDSVNWNRQFSFSFFFYSYLNLQCNRSCKDQNVK